MKHWIFAACLICFGSLARAQNAVNAPAAPTPTSLGTVSGTAMSPDEAAFVAAGAVSVIQMNADVNAAFAALPSGPWAGKLDLTPDFSIGAWQSLKSADEAYGVAKPVWSLQKGGQPLLNVGLFIGEDVLLAPLAKQAPKLIGGATIAVPGSALDWTLGTKMGSYWLPKAKAGLLIAYDFTRPRSLGPVPDFIGVGLSAGFGAPPVAAAR